MKCPIDDTELTMTERQNIEIDYCSKCRGVWLDRGELDKIIERSEQTQRPEREIFDPQAPQREQDYRLQDKHERGNKHGGEVYRKKRGGFLGELFD